MQGVWHLQWSSSYRACDGKSKNKDFDAGFELVRLALREPIKQLCRLSGISFEMLVEKIKNYGDGYNFRTNEFGNLLEMKVIDPRKVTRLSLRYAVSATKLFLSNNIVITINKETKV